MYWNLTDQISVGPSMWIKLFSIEDAALTSVDAFYMLYFLNSSVFSHLNSILSFLSAALWRLLISTLETQDLTQKWTISMY